MRASKTRVAPKSARVAADGGRSVSSSAGTQQQSSTGMSSRLQGAVATVVLLGTVVLLMSSSLSQTGPRHTHLRSSLEPAVLDAPSSLRRPALLVTTAAPPGVALEPPAQLASAARRDTTQDLDLDQANPPEDLAHRAAVLAQDGIVRRDAAPAVDVTATGEVPNHGSSGTAPPSQYGTTAPPSQYGTSTALRGRVEVEATAGQTEAAPLSISAGHQCAPPAVGAGRLAWAAIRNRTSLLPRGCANGRGGDADAAPARELCRLAQAAAGDKGELLLLVGVGARAASLRLTLRSAARAIGL